MAISAYGGIFALFKDGYITKDVHVVYRWIKEEQEKKLQLLTARQLLGVLSEGPMGSS